MYTAIKFMSCFPYIIAYVFKAFCRAKLEPSAPSELSRSAQEVAWPLLLRIALLASLHMDMAN